MESIGAEQQKALAPSSRKEGKREKKENCKKLKLFAKLLVFCKDCVVIYLFDSIERCIGVDARLRGAR